MMNSNSFQVDLNICRFHLRTVWTIDLHELDPTDQMNCSCSVCVCSSGVCREGERLVVGPTDEGRFLRLKVCSIQRNRSACRVLRAGQAATLALGNFDRSLLRKVRGHTPDDCR